MLPMDLYRLLGRRPARPPRPRSRRADRTRPGVEALEVRIVPTTTLFLDFGDAFPGGGRQATVRQLRDTLTGPDLPDPLVGLADTTTLTFAPLTGLVNFDYDGNGLINGQDASSLKSNVVALVQRYYAPFDVN